jgi:hypothetical protein
MSNSSLKVALPTTEVDMKVIRTEFNLPNILKESINFAPFAICTRKDHFFAHMSNKISNGLISGGIIQYWYSYLLDFEAKPLQSEPMGPKVFEVEDLKFGFFVWLSACAISLAAFVVEILCKNVEKIIGNFVAISYILLFLSRNLN